MLTFIPFAIVVAIFLLACLVDAQAVKRAKANGYGRQNAKAKGLREYAADLDARS